MCGRFALTVTPADVQALFGYEDKPNFPPRQNIAPTDPIAVVTFENGKRHFRLMRWGLMPAWVKATENFPTLFNARSETLATKPAFRSAARHRRCLIPADWFYEWTHQGKLKIPYRIMRKDHKVFAMAGLWETYIHPNGSEIDTATIVTTDANGTVSALHNRMPVILDEKDFAVWLDAELNPPEKIAQLMRPAADDLLMIEAFDPRRGKIEADEVVEKKPSRKKDKSDGQASLF